MVYQIPVVAFDGSYGYATCFVEEAFGGLVRRTGKADVLAHLRFISEEEPALIAKVTDCICTAARHYATKVPPRTYATPPPPPKPSATRDDDQRARNLQVTVGDITVNLTPEIARELFGQLINYENAGRLTAP